MRLPSALVQLRHHVLERGGPCHAHRVSRSALLGIQASHGGASGGQCDIPGRARARPSPDGVRIVHNQTRARDPCAPLQLGTQPT